MRWLSAVLAAMVLGVWTGTAPTLPGALAPAVAAQPRAACELRLEFQNRRRRIHGDVNVECGGDGHSAPYGNWGVDSRLSGRYDGWQFAGWKDPLLHDWREWNSCTGKYQGDEFYNDGPGRQRADPDNTRTHASSVRPIYDPRNGTCRDLGEGTVHTERNPYMSLWELDPWGGDDHVTTLRFRSMSVRVSCSSDWYCSGSTSWRSPTGGDADVRAQQRFGVRYQAR